MEPFVERVIRMSDKEFKKGKKYVWFQKYNYILILLTILLLENWKSKATAPNRIPLNDWIKVVSF